MQLTRVRLLQLLAAAPLASCAPRDALRVGSKNFTEELVWENSTRRRSSTPDCPSRAGSIWDDDIAMAALQRNEIDLYPEYTGTALVNVLHLPPQSDPQKSYRSSSRSTRSVSG